MNLNLIANDDEIKEKFASLKTPRDVAHLLEIKYSDLVYLIYRNKPEINYTTFQIKKRSGGFRDICAPISTLKILQRKLNHVLQLIYKPRPCVHGFTRDRSIVTNAQTHIRKNYVLNLDIKDFFPSIHFGRVRGMFLAKPYEVPEKPATVLAQICCFDSIPQGAPTSPVISNMICSKLDGELQRLAQRFHCTYTRYADDITFSSTTPKFPKPLAIETTSGIELGEVLKKCIESNGFHIHEGKVRLQKPDRRQEVTGITVNDMPNVNRRFIRQLRAVIHAWEKYGYENAEREYHEKYCRKRRHPDRPPPVFSRVVDGKLNFLKMVRGEKSPIYRKYASQYNCLIGKPFSPYFDDPHKEIESNLWVLQSEKTSSQGTAFMLDGIGLITCQHVIEEDTHAFKTNDHSKKYPVEVISEDKDIDLAILKIEGKNTQGLKSGDSTNLSRGDKITIAGFPNYWPGDTAYIAEGKITAFRIVSFIKRILISANIIFGNSGGPVLNESNEVIGIAVTGTKYFQSAHTTEKHGVIPVDALKYLKESE